MRWRSELASVLIRVDGLGLSLVIPLMLVWSLGIMTLCGVKSCRKYHEGALYLAILPNDEAGLLSRKCPCSETVIMVAELSGLRR